MSSEQRPPSNPQPPPLDPKLVEAYLKHAACWRSIDTGDTRAFMPGLNLFRDLVERNIYREVYIVDTNASWQKESAHPGNQGVAFVLGMTLDHEVPNLKALFFGEGVDTRNGNIYVIGPEEQKGQTWVKLEKLDEYFRATLDEASLSEASLPLVRRSNPKFHEREAELRSSTEHEMWAVLMLLGVKKVTELPAIKDKGLIDRKTAILSWVKENSSKCTLDWKLSAYVVRHCHAVLLAEKLKARTEFSRPDKRNVCNDAAILHHALFFRARILTEDRLLIRMAGYAGIECVKRVPC